jgi:archaellin
MKSIYEIAQVAREKAQEALEEYVKLRAGFSGVDINKAKTHMIVHYDQALWKGLISMTKEHYSEKDTENSRKRKPDSMRCMMCSKRT